MNGNVKLEQAACGGSQWRMGPTFFKCILFYLFLMVQVLDKTLRIQQTDRHHIFSVGRGMEGRRMINPDIRFTIAQETFPRQPILEPNWQKSPECSVTVPATPLMRRR